MHWTLLHLLRIVDIHPTFNNFVCLHAHIHPEVELNVEIFDFSMNIKNTVRSRNPFNKHTSLSMVASGNLLNETEKIQLNWQSSKVVVRRPHISWLKDLKFLS